MYLTMTPIMRKPPTKPTTGSSLHLPRVRSASSAENMFRNLPSQRHTTRDRDSPQAPNILPCLSVNDNFIGVYLPLQTFMNFLSDRMISRDTVKRDT